MLHHLNEVFFFFQNHDNNDNYDNCYNDYKNDADVIR